MFRAALFLIPVAVLVGLQSAFFLKLFELCWQAWKQNHQLIWGLPFVGLLTVWAYRRWGHRSPGTSEILRTLFEKESHLAPHTSPLVIIFTCLSQLCGASTGREGTAVQFGAATADWVHSRCTKWLPPEFASREFLLRAGIAAGFGAVFSVPWAGGLFAWEIRRHSGRWTWLPWLWLSSFLSYGVRHLCLPESVSPYLLLDPQSSTPWFLLVGLALIIGVFARIFIWAFHRGEQFFHSLGPWFGVLAGTSAVVALTVGTSPGRYNDLGLGLIQESYFSSGLNWMDLVMKFVFTILSAASGLRGGEVTPLLSMGAMSGNLWAGTPSAFFVSMGITTFFAATVGVRWAAAVMAFEFFGWPALLPALLAAFIANRVTGERKLYRF